MEKNWYILIMLQPLKSPNEVIDAICKYYSEYNSNIHRAVYQIAEEATEEYEATRENVRKFINAKYAEEIIFTRNTTESINLVAYSWGKCQHQEGKYNTADRI